MGRHAVVRGRAKHADAATRVTVAELLATPPGDVPSQEDNPDVTSRIALHGFRNTTSQPFRLSEIIVQNELFTHHSQEPPIDDSAPLSPDDL